MRLSRKEDGTGCMTIWLSAERVCLTANKHEHIGAATSGSTSPDSGASLLGIYHRSASQEEQPAPREGAAAPRQTSLTLPHPEASPALQHWGQLRGRVRPAGDTDKDQECKPGTVPAGSRCWAGVTAHTDAS